MLFRSVAQEFRTVVPFNSIDRVMYKDIDAATDFLRYGDFEPAK